MIDRNSEFKGSTFTFLVGKYVINFESEHLEEKIPAYQAKLSVDSMPI